MQNSLLNEIVTTTDARARRVGQKCRHQGSLVSFCKTVRDVASPRKIFSSFSHAISLEEKNCNKKKKLSPPDKPSRNYARVQKGKGTTLKFPPFFPRCVNKFSSSEVVSKRRKKAQGTSSARDKTTTRERERGKTARERSLVSLVSRLSGSIRS